MTGASMQWMYANGTLWSLRQKQAMSAVGCTMDLERTPNLKKHGLLRDTTVLR
jgi:hypothetical protein